jgi:hypothetical protein
MFKVYLITELDGSTVPADIEGNPTLQFAREFLPLINGVLFKPEDRPS